MAGNGSGSGAGVSGDHLSGYDVKRGYACKRDLRKYRKIDQTENDGEADDSVLGANPADSDSEFENIKVKGSSRAKISHVSELQFSKNNFLSAHVSKDFSENKCLITISKTLFNSNEILNKKSLLC